MSRSYVGVVTARGLEALYPENDHIIRFLDRRVFRKPPYGGLCWAVLSDEAVDRIEQQLAIGEHSLAFWTLQALADFCGSILPAHDEEEFGAA